MIARSFALRAVIAFLLLALFYAGALAFGFGLIAFALWSLTLSTNHVHGVIMLIVAGGAVLIGLIPSFTRWVPPGIKVDEREQPRLLRLIRQVAEQVGQPMPAEVYVVADANAFVQQVGGVLGLGGRRVLGVGLVLLDVTNVSQLKAVLAHEFGHFAGGDTRLLGFTSVARGAMIRTLGNAERTAAGFMARPLGWIFKLYLRVTQAISRQQELIADELAVRVAGKTAHASALRESTFAGAKWAYFIDLEVEPLAARGIAPSNLFEGFRSYLGSSSMREWDRPLQDWIAESRQDPYDSHPPLSERIAWAHAQSRESPLDSTSAGSLLDDRPALEEKLSPVPEGLVAKKWSELGPICAKDIQRKGERAQVRVAGMTVQHALDVLAQPARRDDFAEAIDPLFIQWTLPDRRPRIEKAIQITLEGYLGALLVARGYSWQMSPGEALWLQKNDTVVRLRELLAGILEGKRSLESLTTILDGAGVLRSASLEIEERVRWEIEAPRCKVKLEPRDKYVTVLAELANFRLPGCCGICRQPATQSTHTQITGLFAPAEGVCLSVPTCAEHAGKEGKVLALRSWRPMIGEVGFDVKDAEYAELIQTVNS